MSGLADRSCEPCRGGVPPLAPERARELQAQIRDWALVDGHHLEKEWRFTDFAGALAFLNRAGAVCEQEGHHADFKCGWGYVRARIWTHKVDGLTESDFVLAAKFDRI